MECMHPRCAGLDVHKDTVVACVRIAHERGGDAQTAVRTFGTTTSALYELADWLDENRVTHAAMEATGVYWKPVWHVLEDGFELLLANPGHVKNVPGRKTDVNDATWLASLLAHGLIRGSFVPPRSIQELRELSRCRKQFVRERSSHTQRLQKTLEDANIKLASVLSDVTGMSGRKILNAIVDGETDSKVLAALASDRVKASRERLARALQGVVTQHHRFMIRLHLEQIDATNAAIAKVEVKAGEVLAPFAEAVALLVTMPGVSDTVATTIIAEIGADMSRFPRADNLISWAGLCPRNDESAGKRRSTRLRAGAPWLKTIMVGAAWSAVRVKDSYERTMFYRLKARRGPKKAICAVAASLLRSAYFMLLRREPYKSLGADHFDTIDRERAKKRLVARLKNLGYNVEIQEAA